MTSDYRGEEWLPLPLHFVYRSLADPLFRTSPLLLKPGW
jgi:hypothetical protein